MSLVMDSYLLTMQCRNDKLEQALTLIHEVMVHVTGFIPFQHGKLFQMPFSPFFPAEALANLEYFGVSGGKQAFHAQFR